MDANITAAKGVVTVVFASDGGYAAYLAVAIASVVHHASPSRAYRIIVLENGISKFMRARMRRFLRAYPHVELQFISSGVLAEQMRERQLARGGRLGEIGSYDTYARLFLASLLPSCPRAIYLDVDTIVCDDVAKLYDMDMEGRPLAAVRDAYLIAAEEAVSVREALVGRGHDMANYFNAGVLLIDLDLWRQQQAEEKMMSVFLTSPNLMFHDQGLLNIVFQENHLSLPPRWNFLTARMTGIRLTPQIDAETEQIDGDESWGVVHYAGCKPWRDPEDAPLAFLWWEEARRSGFDADVMQVEIAELRRAARAQKDLGRLASLKTQRWTLKLKTRLAGAAKREKYRDRLARLQARIREAEAYRKKKF